MINTGKLRVYSSFPSVYHLLNSDEWMESYEQQKHVKKQSEVQVDMPRSSSLHAVHFRIISFAIKVERMIPPFSQLLENDRNIICVSSSPQSEKVKKYIMREVCTKEISFL